MTSWALIVTPEARWIEAQLQSAKKLLMTYSLIQLAPGAYDLLLNGELMGSVVRVKTQQGATWYAELLEDLPRSKRPAPFIEIEHNFSSLEALCEWLGAPEVKTNNRHGGA
jgi:hypothetical protein